MCIRDRKYTSSGWNWKKMLRKFGEEIIENPEVVKVAWNYMTINGGLANEIANNNI